MSSVHCVVVWEWQCDDQWLPHTPSVARTLERAHAKKLTRVVLADAEPELKGHYVNLRTLTQSSDASEGDDESGESETTCLVRRSCYSVQSPGGRGARWEWASAQHQGSLQYTVLPMEVQCQLEEALSSGLECVWWRGWAARPGARAARGPGGALRLLRRVPQPPYPLARDQPKPKPALSAPLPRPLIPQQHTGCSALSSASASAPPTRALSSASASAPPGPRGGARSAEPRDKDRDRKPGLARQILHNLNIFSHAHHKPGGESQHSTDSEEPRASLEHGNRRHSVDTVSTYLSHESKDSLQQASVGSLLNCSAGSDDVFFTPPPPTPRAPLPLPGAAPAPAPAGDSQDALVGMEGSGPALCVWVGAVSAPHWAAPCPRCRRPLGGDGAGAVALLACQHMMHLHCLDTQLARRAPEPLYISCLVCGRVYGRGGGPARPEGEQPAGSMAWRLQPGALPGCDTSASILVTYSFQSGRQGPRHPAPGAPYYAVGFPRHSLLPDAPLGRQVLAALRRAWERRVLFTVSASLTTGREHVVAWRVAPPPQDREQYAREPDPRRLLTDARDRLLALLDETD